jgi:acyl-CoA thioester hydrolase
VSRSHTKPFRIDLRAYYQDTDAGGVVFHARYLEFMERARTELIDAAGFDLAKLADEQRLMFLVFRIEATYHQPARLHDRLSVTAEVAKMGRASVVFRQRVERGADRLVEADVTLALVDCDRMRPARFPAALAQEFERALK